MELRGVLERQFGGVHLCLGRIDGGLCLVYSGLCLTHGSLIGLIVDDEEQLASLDKLSLLHTHSCDES